MRADWRTSPVSPQLKATFAFIEKQTLRPEELTREDAAAAYAAGVSQTALRDAALVSALFNMIVRLADSFGWDVPEWDALLERAPRMIEGGYVLSSVRGRAGVTNSNPGRTES